jgi:hypothetical protein
LKSSDPKNISYLTDKKCELCGNAVQCSRLLKLSYYVEFYVVVVLFKVMTHLAEYVACIYDMQSNQETRNNHLKIQHVVEQSEQTRLNDITFTQTTKIYTFIDGTQIKQTIEQDNQLFEVEACLESWTEYQVIHQSNKIFIRKKFILIIIVVNYIGFSILIQLKIDICKFFAKLI